MEQMPKIQQLNVALNGLESGVRSSLNQLEALTETLRAMFSEFDKNYKKQREVLRKRDAAQRRQLSGKGPVLGNPLVGLFEDVFQKR